MPEGDGPTETAAADEDVMGAKVINNGLLCSILQCMSSAPNAEDLIARIERDVEKPEILEARKKLFSYFRDVICNERKKPVLEVERNTTKRYIQDIVNQLLKVDRETEIKMFCMPYDYDRQKFESEGERFKNVIEKEVANEFDLKIEALEHRMNEKHRELHNSIVESVNRAMQAKTSYASAAAYGGTKPKELGSDGPPVVTVMGPPPAPLVGGHARAEVPGVAQEGGGGHRTEIRQQNFSSLGQGNSRFRGRSPSVKRGRGDSPVSTADRSSSRPPKQMKCVVGTSNNAVQTSRKMRSPPADIFVWGVHPETTLQDIIADLADSGVIVEEKDIEKKSKPEAFLCSYKISVKAEQLAIALDPNVWPLRVKVREYIYYSKKNPRQDRHDRQAGHSGQAVGGHAGHGQHQQHAVQVGPQSEHGELPLVHNRYELPEGMDVNNTTV